MAHAREFDIVVFGATGYTGGLVARHMAEMRVSGRGFRWAVAGRDRSRLESLRESLGDPAVAVVMADAADPASIARMVDRTAAVATAASPYQQVGSELLARCAERGVDYLDVCGETHWMRWMIDAHERTARASGARILFSCGFDTVPFEFGVQFVQDLAQQAAGRPAPRVKARVRQLSGTQSAGTIASARATMNALSHDTSLLQVLTDPFGLTPGFVGPPQPRGIRRIWDADLEAEVAPFAKSAINIKNVHRSNHLLGYPWGRDFVYDEMAVVGEGGPAGFESEIAFAAPGQPVPPPTVGGGFDILFLAQGPDRPDVCASVSGAEDGYTCSARILAEAALELAYRGASVPAGILTASAALGAAFRARLTHRVGLTFMEEARVVAATA